MWLSFAAVWNSKNMSEQSRGHPPPLEPDNIPSTKLSGAWLQLARLTWLILAVVAIGILVAAFPGYAAKFGGQLSLARGSDLPPGAAFFAAASGAASLASALLSLGLSALLFRRRLNEPVAALLSLFLLIYAFVMSGPLEFASAHWLGSQQFALAAQSFLLVIPAVALFMVFPTGQFIPSWTRWTVLLSVPLNLVLLLAAPFDAGSLSGDPFLSVMAGGLFIGFFAVGVYAQIYRYRHASTSMQRRQTRWALYGFGLWFSYMLVSSIPYYYATSLPPNAPTPWWLPASELGWWLSLNIIPVCLTIAITRYHLWDIDLIVNRTLVYGALTASVVALYALIVGGVGLLFRTDDNLFLPLLATGLAAALSHPLRLRLQRAINRFMYGERDEPFEVVARLGERLESTLSPELVYPTIVETVSQTLKLPYAAITIWRNGQLATAESYGKPVDDPVNYPLTYHGELVGQLQVARRASNEAFSEADERILSNIARQAGAAVHAVQLMADLQESRRQLVTAREEERRRLRRDLHDGLGAALAGLHLEAGVLRRLIRTHPQEAEATVDEFRKDIRATIDEIRHLVYELRPPTLDQLGLAAAVRAQALQCSQAAPLNRPGENGDSNLQVEVDAPEELPPLPAAVEVAAYRIVQEALTNVVRHAQASHCFVRMEMAEALRVEIVDDGVGFARTPDEPTGLGLLSMRERATELGGTCLIDTASGGGTCVLAHLPLPPEALRAATR